MSKVCIICSRPGRRGYLTKGRCDVCRLYLKKHGVERPVDLNRGDTIRGERNGMWRRGDLVSGEKHYRWKGDAAKPAAGRDRARDLFPLGPCERCGKPGVDRHHKDENTLNNGPENIQILCRRCHMEVDGRLHGNGAKHKGKKQGPLSPEHRAKISAGLRRRFDMPEREEV